MRAPIRDIIWLPGRKVTAKEILAQVAHRRGLTVEEMLSASRKQPLAHARQEAMWEIRQRTNLSLPQIASRLKLKSHTTVWHGILAHEGRLAALQEAA